MTTETTETTETIITDLCQISTNVIAMLDEDINFLTQYINSSARSPKAASIVDTNERKMKSYTQKIHQWSNYAKELNRQKCGEEEIYALALNLKEILDIHEYNSYLLSELPHGPQKVHDNHAPMLMQIKDIRYCMEALKRITYTYE